MLPCISGCSIGWRVLSLSVAAGDACCLCVPVVACLAWYVLLSMGVGDTCCLYQWLQVTRIVCLHQQMGETRCCQWMQMTRVVCVYQWLQGSDDWLCFFLLLLCVPVVAGVGWRGRTGGSMAGFLPHYCRGAVPASLGRRASACRQAQQEALRLFSLSGGLHVQCFTPTSQRLATSKLNDSYILWQNCNLASLRSCSYLRWLR